MWNEFKIIYKNNLLLQIFWESNIMYEKKIKNNDSIIFNFIIKIRKKINIIN